MVSAATYILNNYSSLISKCSKNGIKFAVKNKIIIKYMILFSVGASIIGTILPQQHLTNMSSEIYNNYRKSGNGLSKKDIESSYDMGYSGYSDSEKVLGGPISVNDDVALRVRSDKPYYLKGSIKDKYTGYSWTASKYSYKKINTNQYMDDSAIINNFDSSSDVVESKSIEIYPAELSTTSFFTPMYSNKIVSENIKPYYDAENGVFMNDGYVSKKYSVSFYDLKISDYAMRQYGLYYMDQSKYDKYLQLPNTITQRTVDLVYKLVKDCNSDAEKAEKIKNYLSDNYKYTLDGPYLPHDRDFVDYFLFEKKKGYCVYFATAMTIMYRIAGIPARFVEGYKMDGSKKKDGLYEVTNAQAHAWCEYMLTKDLWTISDASPTPLQNENEKKKKKAQAVIKAKIKKSSDKEKQQKDTSQDKNKTKDNKQISQKSITNSAAIKMFFRAIQIIVLAVVIVLAALYFINRNRHLKKTMLFGKSILPLYRYMLKRLSRLGIKKKLNETDMEFAEKLEEELKAIVKPVTERVYEEFYGAAVSSDVNKEKLYKNFKLWIKKSKNRKKFKITLVK